MEMEAMVNLFLNTGVTVVVIAYFMYRDNKFMTELQKTLTTVKDSLDVISDMISRHDENV